MNSNKVILILAGAVLLGVAVFFLTGSSDKAAKSDVSTEIIEEEAISDDEVVEDENHVVFDLTGRNFEFTQDNLEVKVGQTVTVKFSSESGFHNWTIDEFDVATERVNAGDISEVTFVAGETGEFEYYCNVGQHRSLGMVGTLTVTE